MLDEMEILQMASQKVIKKRVKKYGAGTNYLRCNLCKGTGRVPKGYNKKKG